MAADALLFDLDGTLWDSWPWFAKLIGKDDPARCAEIRRALESGRPIASLLRKAHVTRARFARLCDEEPRCRLYPGAGETLAELNARGAPTAVVTNLPEWIAAPMLDALEIAEQIGVLVHYSSAAKPKPHPAPINFALEELGLEASEDVWYVGDTASDATAAGRAGVSFAWASYGYGDEPEEADAVIDEVGGVLAL